jgi:hypothetical protein
MSIKPTANIALAIAVIAGASAFGAWWGQRTFALPEPNAQQAATSRTQGAGPLVPRPRALVGDPPQEEILAPSGSAGSLAGAKGQAPEIVPGGAVAGNAVNRLWETTASQPWQVRAAPITPPNWTITGVVQRGDKTQIIVQFDGEPAPRFLKIGDVLPGGSKLAWVRPGTIGVVTPNRKRLGVPVLPNIFEPAAAPSASPGQKPTAPAR